MDEKMRAAGIRALWTLVQTFAATLVANGTGFTSTDWKGIAFISFGAALTSFVKSIGLGMPETNVGGSVYNGFMDGLEEAIKNKEC